MQNFRLNRGGFIGGLVGLAGVVTLYFMAQSNEATQQEPIRPLLVLIMLAGVTGNVIWDKIAAKRDRPTPASEASQDAASDHAA